MCHIQSVSRSFAGSMITLLRLLITRPKNNTLQGQSLCLFFSEITKEDEGQYTCKAENAAGFSTKDIDISVKGVFVKLTTVL